MSEEVLEDAWGANLIIWQKLLGAIEPRRKYKVGDVLILRWRQVQVFFVRFSKVLALSAPSFYPALCCFAD